VKPQRGVERRREQTSKVRVSRSGAPPAAALDALSEDEAAVVECLRQAESGLTARQLQSRVSCAPDVLEQVLSTLVERDLVARWNTIIPSYSCRRPGAGAHDE
jgi:hypothetical protein